MTCLILTPFIMLNFHYACPIYYKNLEQYGGQIKSQNSPIHATSNCITFHVKRLYNRWMKEQIKQNFSNHLEISFNTRYHANSLDNVVKKGSNYMYHKFYYRFDHHNSKDYNVCKKQQVHFEQKCRQIFNSSKLQF